MDITPTIPKGRQLITGYGNGGFKINGEFVAGSRLVLVGETLPWNVTTAADITLDSLISVMPAQAGIQLTSKELDASLRWHDKIELLLIGSGSTMTPLNPTIRQQLKAHGIAVDIMDTGAACRTYNVLLSEERKVAAALIAV